jgi:hypothetical protein
MKATFFSFVAAATLFATTAAAAVPVDHERALRCSPANGLGWNKPSAHVNVNKRLSKLVGEPNTAMIAVRLSLPATTRY